MDYFENCHPDIVQDGGEELFEDPLVILTYQALLSTFLVKSKQKREKYSKKFLDVEDDVVIGLFLKVSTTFQIQTRCVFRIRYEINKQQKLLVSFCRQLIISLWFSCLFIFRLIDSLIISVAKLNQSQFRLLRTAQISVLYCLHQFIDRFRALNYFLFLGALCGSFITAAKSPDPMDYRNARSRQVLDIWCIAATLWFLLDEISELKRYVFFCKIVHKNKWSKNSMLTLIDNLTITLCKEL